MSNLNFVTGVTSVKNVETTTSDSTLNHLSDRLQPSSLSQNIVFIDPTVEDYQSLMDGVVARTEVILLNPSQDGVEQITEHLINCSTLDNVHIVSHGSPGCLYLGNSQLSLDTLEHYKSQLKTGFSNSVNLFLYGCNVAAGDAGAELIEKLHQLTGAEIAASANPTGNSGLGGDWELEVTTQGIEVSLAFSEEVQSAYASVLAKWIPQGPGPSQNGDVENVTPNNEVVGAIHTVLAHPTDADTLWIGATNGGIWRTTNATDTSPNWEPLTDEFRGLSIGAMAFDPTDTDPEGDGPTIIAGIGRFSSFFRQGGPLTGLLLSTDGGDNFTEISDPLLQGRNISGVAIRGETILASANNFGGGTGAGVYRSTDQGVTWDFISDGNILPSKAAFDLVGDPTYDQQFYVSVQGKGIFHSDDAGKTWTNVSDADADLNGAITAFGNNNTEMAVASDGRLYVAVLSNGQPSYIGFTDNPTADNPTWEEMDLPITPETVGGNPTNVGLNPTPKPGGQGGIHFSIIADPNNPDIIYVGGDRQGAPRGQTTTFPTFVGANSFSGKLFRGDTTIQPTNGSPSPQWEHLTHSDSIAAIPDGGTISNSAPHADSREMTFDANGDIIEVDDGGIYRRTNPQNNSGDWFSINGDLQVTEIHDIAYDTVSNIIISGNQDTGTTQQTAEGSKTWDSVFGTFNADGGDVAVSVDPNNSSQSVRYSSTQNLGLGFNSQLTRRVYDTSNNLVSSTTASLNGFMPSDVQFVTPVVVNEVDPNRIAIGGANNVYESFDQGNNVDIVNTVGGGSVGVNGSNFNPNGDPIVYGGKQNGEPNKDVLYVGSGSRVFRRTASGGFLENINYPSFGSVRDIVLDRDDWISAFVIDNDEVFQTIDASNDNTDNDNDGDIDEANEIDWRQITGNLVTDFRDGFDLDFRSIEFIDIPSLDDAIAVGTNRGIFASLGVTDFSDWFQVGTDLPNVPVWDLDYDPTDDVLVAGTLGRGAWSFPDASTSIKTIVSSVIATREDDLLIGTPDPDNIDALAGDDTVRGLEGDDTLIGNKGEDNIDGNEGNDQLEGGKDEDTLNGSQGEDTLEGEKAEDLLEGGEGNDQLDGGKDEDTLNGGAGDDTLRGEKADDVLEGGEGNDLLEGGKDEDILNGGTGNDTLKGQEGRDTLDGSLGNDLLDGGDHNDTITGGEGNDTLKGSDNDDELIGVDPSASQPGLGEIDTLTGDDPGDEDDDIFVLGDTSKVYYDGNNQADYALITDFDDKDLIQLKGSAGNYELRSSPAGLPSGTAIFLTTGGSNELIGIVQGTSELNLLDDKIFSFV